MGKSTLRTHRYIIKGSDESAPYLGFNEFHTMRVLARLQVVPVAKTRMSDDGRLLIVDRFDVDDKGASVYGLEDTCSLLGLPPHEKYATTMEKVLNAARAYLPAAQVRSQLEQLGWHVLTNYVVRNADCHSKNIALYYTSPSDVSFTPIFDLVTTQAYPRYAANPPGLSIEGRRTWMPGKSLERFFNARLGIAPRHYAKMIERLCESATEVAQEIIAAAKNETRWRGISKQMLYAWNEGMKTLRGPTSKTGRVQSLDAVIAQSDFSAPLPAETSREMLGRSELFAKPKKRKRRRGS